LKCLPDLDEIFALDNSGDLLRIKKDWAALREMKITHKVAFNFHPIFIPLNQIVGGIYEECNWDNFLKVTMRKKALFLPAQAASI